MKLLNRKIASVSLSRLTSLGLAVVFSSQTAFSHLPESHFWKERQEKLAWANPSRIHSSIPSAIKSVDSLLQSKTNLSSLRSKNPQVAELLSAIPAHQGTVRKMSVAKEGQQPIIVLIQDVHRNSEAQANISGLTQSLIRTDKIKNVFLEGAVDKIDFSLLRSFPYPESTKAVADYLLKEHFITGPSYTALTEAGAIPIFRGVDHKFHYNANIEAYRTALPQMEKVKKSFGLIEDEWKTKKENQLNTELKSFDRQVEAYRKGQVAMSEFARYLKTHSIVHAKSQVALFLSAVDLEKNLNFSHVEVEQRLLVEQLVGKLNSRKTEDLARAAVGFRLGDVSHHDFYGFLKNLCHAAFVDVNRYSSLSDYLRYIELAQKISPEQLDLELNQLEEEFYRRLVKSDVERELINQRNSFHLVSKLLDFSLTPSEWGEYKNSVNRPWTIDHSLNLLSFERFYEEAEARDEAMVSEVLRHTNEKNLEASILVVGGFHSPGISRRLQQAGYGVIQVTPRLSKVDSDSGSAYLSFFAQEKTPLDKLFRGEKLFVSQPPMVSARSTLLFQTSHALLTNPAASFAALQLRYERWLKGGKAAVDLVSRQVSLVFGRVRFTLTIAADKSIESASLEMNAVKPAFEELVYSALPLLIQPHSIVFYFLFRLMFVILHLFQNGPPKSTADAFSKTFIPVMVSVASLSAYGSSPVTTILVGFGVHVFLNLLQPLINAIGAYFQIPVTVQKGALESIIPENLKRIFGKARHINPFGRIAFLWNGRNLVPEGFLVPKGEGDKYLDEEQVISLVLDPRKGGRVMIVEDNDHMTYLALYVALGLMQNAQRQYSLGLATGGTTEDVRKAMGLAELAGQVVGSLPDYEKIKLFTTLDDYFWKPDQAVDTNLEHLLSSYRQEQLYMLLRNLFPGKTDAKFEKFFISPLPAKNPQAAGKQFRKDLETFLTTENRILWQLFGVGTSSHDAFNETDMPEHAAPEIVKTNLDELLRIPDDLKRVAIDQETFTNDRAVKLLEITKVQNAGFFVPRGFHPFFLRFMGDKDIGDIRSLLNVLSGLDYDDVASLYPNEKKYQFASREKYLEEFQYLLDHFQRTPDWAVSQGTAGILERLDNEDSVSITMVSSFHKQRALWKMLQKAPGAHSSAGLKVHFAPRSLVIATEESAKTIDHSRVFYFRPTQFDRAKFNSKLIDEQWRATPEGKRFHRLLERRNGSAGTFFFWEYLGLSPLKTFALAAVVEGALAGTLTHYSHGAMWAFGLIVGLSLLIHAFGVAIYNEEEAGWEFRSLWSSRGPPVFQYFVANLIALTSLLPFLIGPTVTSNLTNTLILAVLPHFILNVISLLYNQKNDQTFRSKNKTSPWIINGRVRFGHIKSSQLPWIRLTSNEHGLDVLRNGVSFEDEMTWTNVWMAILKSVKPEESLKLLERYAFPTLVIKKGLQELAKELNLSLEFDGESELQSGTMSVEYPDGIVQRVLVISPSAFKSEADLAYALSYEIARHIIFINPGYAPWLREANDRDIEIRAAYEAIEILKKIAASPDHSEFSLDFPKRLRSEILPRAEKVYESFYSGARWTINEGRFVKRLRTRLVAALLFFAALFVNPISQAQTVGGPKGGTSAFVTDSETISESEKVRIQNLWQIIVSHLSSDDQVLVNRPIPFKIRFVKKRPTDLLRADGKTMTIEDEDSLHAVTMRRPPNSSKLQEIVIGVHPQAFETDAHLLADLNHEAQMLLYNFMYELDKMRYVNLKINSAEQVEAWGAQQAALNLKRIVSDSNLRESSPGLVNEIEKVYIPRTETFAKEWRDTGKKSNRTWEELNVRLDPGTVDKTSGEKLSLAIKMVLKRMEPEDLDVLHNPAYSVLFVKRDPNEVNRQLKNLQPSQPQPDAMIASMTAYLPNKNKAEIYILPSIFGDDAHLLEVVNHEIYMTLRFLRTDISQKMRGLSQNEMEISVCERAIANLKRLAADPDMQRVYPGVVKSINTVIIPKEEYIVGYWRTSTSMAQAVSGKENLPLVETGTPWTLIGLGLLVLSIFAGWVIKRRQPSSRYLGSLFLLSLFLAGGRAEAQSISPAFIQPLPALVVAEQNPQDTQKSNVVKAVRAGGGTYLDVKGDVWSGTPGFAYQPTPNGDHINAYEQGRLADLYKALLPANGEGIDPQKYPDLVELAKKRGGAAAQGHAKLLAGTGAKFIRTYNLAGSTEADLKSVNRIFVWMYEQYGIMFTAGMYDPRESDVKKMTAIFKDNPGLLLYDGWNEVDMRGANKETFQRIDRLAGILKEGDKNHPVALVVSRSMNPDQIRAIREMKHIDIVSITIYDLDGVSMLDYLNTMRPVLDPKVVIVGETGVKSGTDPAARAQRASAVVSPLIRIDANQWPPAPLITWFAFTNEEWKIQNKDDGWGILGKGNVLTPTYAALSEVYNKWVAGTLPEGVVSPPSIPPASDIKLIATSSKIGLEAQYEGTDYFGKYAVSNKENSDAILAGDYFRIVVSGDKSIRGFHVELKEKQGPDVGFFSLFVTKKTGTTAWTLSKSAMEVRVTEKLEGDRLVVTLDIPVADIKAALQNSGSLRIAEIHVQSGRQQRGVPLNDANVSIGVSYEVMKKAPKGGYWFDIPGYPKIAAVVETLVARVLPVAGVALYQFMKQGDLSGISALTSVLLVVFIPAFFMLMHLFRGSHAAFKNGDVINLTKWSFIVAVPLLLLPYNPDLALVVYGLLLVPLTLYHHRRDNPGRYDPRLRGISRAIIRAAVTMENGHVTSHAISDLLSVGSLGVDSATDSRFSGYLGLTPEQRAVVVAQVEEQLKFISRPPLTLAQARRAVFEMHGFDYIPVLNIVGNANVALDLNVQTRDDIPKAVTAIRRMLAQMSQTSKLIVPGAEDAEVQLALVQELEGVMQSRVLFVNQLGKKYFTENEQGLMAFDVATFLESVHLIGIKNVYVATQGEFFLNPLNRELFKQRGVLADVVLIAEWLNGVLGMVVQNQIPLGDIDKLARVIATAA